MKIYNKIMKMNKNKKILMKQKYKYYNNRKKK